MTLLIYQSRINLLTNTAHVQGQIDETKESADLLTNKKDAPLVRISLARTPTALERSVDNSIQYYERRLVPSAKESWNAQVAKVASAIIQSDLPRRTGKFILRNVFGHNEA
ncbi:hypothetical protein G6F61_001530 [Rhizopus arrhizus]|nr:hypothetical protein G6F61_001530 [Rhizopus arrhizus]